MKILESLEKLLRLTKVSIKTSLFENLSEDREEVAYSRILEILKSNVSIISLQLMDPKIQNQKYPDIGRELRKNIGLRYSKESLLRLDRPESKPIFIEEIKLCLQMKVQLELYGQISSDDFKTLRYYLKHPNHKITILNVARVDNDYMIKLINLLNENLINYKTLKIFNFGYRNLEQKIFIMFSKWLLNKFSLYKDNDDLKLRNFLFSCR